MPTPKRPLAPNAIHKVRQTNKAQSSALCTNAPSCKLYTNPNQIRPKIMQFQASQKHKSASNLDFPTPKINATLYSF